MNDPYDILGVPHDATPAHIKSAYRAKARRDHPDAGGDANDFKAAAAAYRLLTDPDARARYDATGDGTKVDVDAEVPKILALAFGAVLQQRHTDGEILPAVRRWIEEVRRKARLELKQLAELTERLRRQRARVTVPPGVPNVLHGLIDNELRAQALEVDRYEQHLVLADLCDVALEAYSEDWSPGGPDISEQLHRALYPGL